jgi:HK97 family phage prohead protease
MSRYPKLAGYAAIWSSLSGTPKRGYYERFAAGAFGGSTDFDQVKALWLHHYETVLAFNGDRRAGGSLTLREDGRGLAFEIEPYEDSAWIDHAISDVRSGRIRGMSCGYHPLDFSIDRLASGLLVCTTTRAQLLEISPVYAPLYRATNIHVVEPPAAATVSQPEPAAIAAPCLEVLRIDPALFARARRQVRAGMIVNC